MPNPVVILVINIEKQIVLRSFRHIAQSAMNCCSKLANLKQPEMRLVNGIKPTIDYILNTMILEIMRNDQELTKNLDRQDSDSSNLWQKLSCSMLYGRPQQEGREPPNEIDEK